jgi:hypothetical protein
MHACSTQTFESIIAEMQPDILPAKTLLQSLRFFAVSGGAAAQSQSKMRLVVTTTHHRKNLLAN